MERLDLEFGDRLLSPDSKRAYNKIHFGVAASRYDFATKAMSLGLDPSWKKRLVDSLPFLDAPSCLDLASGTGDVALLLSERYPNGTIVGLDISDPMLKKASGRIARRNVRFEKGDMCSTGFADNKFDIITGSYALRNAPDLAQLLKEIGRILKPGGVASFLDFSKSADCFSRKIQRRLLRSWCGLWGLILHGDTHIHGYIAESLETFPDRLKLHNAFRESGFEVTDTQAFLFGMLELVVLRKN